jgi:hypothetical protein
LVGFQSHHVPRFGMYKISDYSSLHLLSCQSHAE